MRHPIILSSKGKIFKRDNLSYEIGNNFDFYTFSYVSKYPLNYIKLDYTI